MSDQSDKQIARPSRTSYKFSGARDSDSSRQKPKQPKASTANKNAAKSKSNQQSKSKQQSAKQAAPSVAIPKSAVMGEAARNAAKREAQRSAKQAKKTAAKKQRTLEKQQAKQAKLAAKQQKKDIKKSKSSKKSTSRMQPVALASVAIVIGAAGSALVFTQLDTSVQPTDASQATDEAAGEQAGEVQGSVDSAQDLTALAAESTNEGEAQSVEQFDPVTPNGSALPENNNFDEEIGIQTYVDTIGQQGVIITQQALPQEIINEELPVKRLALSLDKLISIDEYEVDFGVMYVVNQTGDDQSAVFAMRQQNVLVFIASENPIASEQWIAYVNSLR